MLQSVLSPSQLFFFVPSLRTCHQWQEDHEGSLSVTGENSGYVRGSKVRKFIDELRRQDAPEEPGRGHEEGSTLSASAVTGNVIWDSERQLGLHIRGSLCWSTFSYPQNFVLEEEFILATVLLLRREHC